MNFLKAFEEDCKYYDLDKKEIKAITKYGNIKNKIILDVGSGTGRLAFLLSKFAKKIIALDYDKRFKRYFKNNKKVEFVNKKVEDYLEKNKNFNTILLAWPVINCKFLDLIKKSMNKKSIFILITCSNNSDYESIESKIGIKKENKKSLDTCTKSKFLSLIPKKFKILTYKEIKTDYRFPNKRIALKIIKNSLILWSKIKLTKENEKELLKIINKHKKYNKIIFNEKIFFYVLKSK